MGQKYKNDPKRAKNRKIGHFSSGPQSIILKIAWNDLSICILTGLGSTFWVTEKSGQKWFHGSVAVVSDSINNFEIRSLTARSLKTASGPSSNLQIRITSEPIHGFTFSKSQNPSESNFWNVGNILIVPWPRMSEIINKTGRFRPILAPFRGPGGPFSNPVSRE